jgi:hypothetical protein
MLRAINSPPLRASNSPMPRLREKALPLLLVILSTCSYGQKIMTQDSTLVQTMRSVIVVQYPNRPHDLYRYMNGNFVSQAQVKAACMTFDSSAVAYASYEKMMSHVNRAGWTFLIGEGAALVMLPLFTQPSVYNSQFWQTAIVILAVGSFVYALAWGAISHAKLARAIRLYNRSLFIRAGIPTRHMHHKIKYYYRHVYGVF